MGVSWIERQKGQPFVAILAARAGNRRSLLEGPKGAAATVSVRQKWREVQGLHVRGRFLVHEMRRGGAKGPIEASISQLGGGAVLGGKRRWRRESKNSEGRRLLWDEVGAQARIKRRASKRGRAARKGSIRFLM